MTIQSPLLYIIFTTKEFYLNFWGVFSRLNACDKLCRRYREFWWALLKTPPMCILSYQILLNERLLQLLIRNLGEKSYYLHSCENKLLLNKIDVQHFTIKGRQHAVWSKLSPLRRRSFNSLYTFNVLGAQKQYLFKIVLIEE